MHLDFAHKYKWGSATENISGKRAGASHTPGSFTSSGRQMRIFDAQLRKEFI